MASASTVSSVLAKISAKHLECIICRERYKQPKMLGCQHSFCEECLEIYRDARYRGVPKIPCPVCRREMALPESGIQGLQINFHLAGMVEAFSLQEKIAHSGDTKLLCEICDEDNEALHRCLDCAMNVCSNCRKTHLKFPVSANHTVATLEDIRQGKVTVKTTPDEYKCHKHKGIVKQIYCRTEQELICHVCAVVDHKTPEHDITDVETAAKEYKESLSDKFPAFSRDIEGHKGSLLDASEAKQVLNNSTAKARQAVQDRAAEVIAKVRAEEKRLLDEITIQEQDYKDRLDEYEKTVSDMLQRKQHSLETAQDVTNNASDSDFLSLYPVISKDMDRLGGEHPPKIQHKLWYLRFKPSQEVGDIKLGEMVMEDSWELCHDFGRKGRGPGEFAGARGIAAAPPDEIAVADEDNNRVVIYNNQGQIKHSIKGTESPCKLLS